VKAPSYGTIISERTSGMASQFRGRSRGLVERSLSTFIHTLQHTIDAEQIAKKKGLLQRFDPRLKILGMLPLIAIAALTRQLWVIGGLFGVALTIALLSQVSLRTLASRVWLGVLAFTGLISVPAVFLTRGRVVYILPILGWSITAQGVRAATYLIARTETAATFSVLLVLCTPWSHVLKALRVLRIPLVLVVILGMTYRYILLLLRTAHEMFQTRRSRMVGRLDGPELRRIATASAGVLMSKTLQLSGDVYTAMRSRGFCGEAYLVDDFRTDWVDWITLAMFTLIAVLAVWFGR